MSNSDIEIFKNYFKKVLQITNVNDYISDFFIERYLNKKYNYGYITKIFKKLIYYKKKFNAINECELCKNNIVHSIVYRGETNINDEKNNIDKICGVIYIEPANATNIDYYYVCQHFLLELDKCLKENENMIIIFNMRNIKTKDYIEHIKIAYHMYKILQDCYKKDLINIYVSNLSAPIELFTRFFSFSFNKKIKIKSFREVSIQFLNNIKNSENR